MPELTSQKSNGNLLKVEDIVKTFSGVAALGGVSFNVPRGAIKALIGPNGAGKTTLLNVISGLLKPDSGYVMLENENLTHSDPHEIAYSGIARTFQLLRLFTVHDMTVLDNVMLGAHKRLEPCIRKSVLLRRRERQRETTIRDEAMHTLRFLGLEHAANLSPLALSFGNQRMVELARALMTSPKLLLLDEPASGLNDKEVDGFMELLLAIRGRGITLLLVEHNMKLVMKLAEDITVVDFGQKIADGTPAQISKNPQVIKAYLGEDHIECNGA